VSEALCLKQHNTTTQHSTQNARRTYIERESRHTPIEFGDVIKALTAQVVEAERVGVAAGEEALHRSEFVAVHALCAFGRVTHRNDAVGHVRLCAAKAQHTTQSKANANA
jgi:hypothetical protein